MTNKDKPSLQSEITSPKIKRLERLLEERRSKLTVKEKIKRKEDLLEFIAGEGK